MEAAYEVNNVSVATLLEYVKDGIIAIPEIQRPFVWDSTKVRDLIDSLYRGYPVGYIITWKSPDVKLKDGSKSEGKQILIDGQQRITALTAALLGQEILNENYKRTRIKIAFNVKEEKFQTLNPAIEKQEDWIPDISEFMKSGNINIWEFVEQYADKFKMDKNTVNERINRLQQVKNILIGRIELGSRLDIDTVTEIFIRINSKGVVLSQADFAMSKISVNEKYGGNDIRKTIDYFCHIAKTPSDFDSIKENDKTFVETEEFKKIFWIKEKADDIYLPTYTDVLRVAFTYKFKRGKLQDLVSLLSGRDFETREYREEIIEDSYNKLRDGVNSFINQTNYERYMMIIKSTGAIRDDLIRSQSVVNFGYILYLLLRENNISPELVEKQVRRWIVMSILTQRYTSSPESQFDYDIRRLNVAEDINAFIDEEISQQLNDTFWSGILVTRLNTSVASSPYWKTFIMSQVKLGDRGFLSKEISVRSLIENRGDVHHIFPKDYLQKNGYNKSSDFNQIANFAMLQTEVNIQISNRAPIDYMQSVLEQCNGGENKYGGISDMTTLEKNMAENCIPSNFSTMDVNSYDDFLKARRVLMAKKLKEYFESL